MVAGSEAAIVADSEVATEAAGEALEEMIEAAHEAVQEDSAAVVGVLVAIVEEVSD